MWYLISTAFLRLFRRIKPLCRLADGTQVYYYTKPTKRAIEAFRDILDKEDAI